MLDHEQLRALFMIINNITGHKNKKNSVILPFGKKNIFKIKINKSIEIGTVHNPGNKNFHQDKHIRLLKVTTSLLF